jgi:CheY-like chemotaxis protein
MVVPASDYCPSELQCRTILIVEDEALVRMVVADDFRASGYIVIECATGDEAWDLLISGVEVDLLFSDVQMPGRLDGLALARAVRERNPALPIMIVSAHLPAAEAGEFDAFLPKPFSSEMAMRQIESLLEEAAADHPGKEPA